MSDWLIEEYARLVSTDKTGCAALFADNAEYVTVVGTTPIHLTSRAEIQAFLTRIPPQLTFRVLACAPFDDYYLAGMVIEGPDIEPVPDRVLFKTNGTLITFLQVLHD